MQGRDWPNAREVNLNAMGKTTRAKPQQALYQVQTQNTNRMHDPPVVLYLQLLQLITAWHKHSHLSLPSHMCSIV